MEVISPFCGPVKELSSVDVEQFAASEISGICIKPDVGFAQMFTLHKKLRVAFGSMG